MREDQPSEADIPTELPDGLNEFARQLSGFQASPSTLDREQLMFEAGRTAALAEINHATATRARLPSVRILRMWQTAAMLMTAVTLGLATTVIVGSNPEPRVIIVERDRSPEKMDVQHPQPTEAAVETQVNHAQRSPAINGEERAAPPGNISSPTLSDKRPTVRIQRARELALADSLNPQHYAVRSRPVSDVTNNDSPTEPPLTPLLLMGDKSGLAINRLMEDPHL